MSAVIVWHACGDKSSRGTGRDSPVRCQRPIGHTGAHLYGQLTPTRRVVMWTATYRDKAPPDGVPPV